MVDVTLMNWRCLKIDRNTTNTDQSTLKVVRYQLSDNPNQIALVTYDIIGGAANGVSTARVAANRGDRKGAAANTDEGVDGRREDYPK